MVEKQETLRGNDFEVAIKENAQRIQDQKVKRLKEMKDAYTVAVGADFKLHEGFSKQCGLKGSMLSGGQK